VIERDGTMSRITITYGKPPGRDTKNLEGETVGHAFDDPEEGLLKVWANTEDSNRTVIISSADLIVLDMEIIKGKTR